MKRCPKCSSDLKLSKFKNLHGYESYRCTNKDCRNLLDISDLDIVKTKSSQLLKPKGLHPHQEYYFEELLKNKKTNIPIGSGKAHFLLKICDENPNSLIVCSSNLFVSQYVEFMNQMYQSQNIKSIFPERIVPYHFIKKYEGKIKDKILLIDELPRTYENDLISNLNGIEDFYIINH